jgi:hypothetical protein
VITRITSINIEIEMMAISFPVSAPFDRLICLREMMAQINPAGPKIKKSRAIHGDSKSIIFLTTIKEFAELTTPTDLRPIYKYTPRVSARTGINNANKEPRERIKAVIARFELFFPMLSAN